MAVCERCGKGEGEWRCQTCGKVVCENCARPTAQGVYCADHVPTIIKGGGKAAALPSAGSSIFKSLFMMILFLTLGLGLIIIIGDFFIGMIQVPAGTPDFAQGIIDIIIRIKGSGTLILLGMAALTALLGVAWYGSRKAA
ncbi:MAG: hypothetical protein QXU82_02885 [Candidatus Aenigmatarchaeota archaeon]